jgi:hypothetical protein
MKIGEILRTIADAMDQHEAQPAVTEPRDDVQNYVDQEQVQVSNNVEDPEDLFLPPLQMKIELLKKAVGVENVYDDGTDTEQHEEYVGSPDTQQDSGNEDELAQMKRRAGINTVVAFDLADDEPLEN